MRALVLGFWIAVGAGCTEVNNFYDCEAVDDGGCMSRDHWGDDQLEDDAGPRRGSGPFTDDSKSQDSIVVTEGRPPVSLVDVRTRDNTPRLITINLASPAGQALDPNSVAIPIYAEPVATIEFGVGGTPYRCEVDYGVGQQFSLLTSRIRILAEYRSLAGAPAIVTPQTLALAASVGPGVVAQPKAPTRTIYPVYLPFGLAPGGSSGVLTIPMFAKSMVIHAVTTLGTIPATVRVWTYGMGITWQNMALIAAWPSQEIPLTNDARYVVLDNVGPGTIYAWRVVFNLAL